MPATNLAVDTGPAETDTYGLERKSPLRGLRLALIWLGSLLALAAVIAIWLGVQASTLYGELDSANKLVTSLKDELASNDQPEATATAEQIRNHTSTAKKIASEPLWTMATAIPGLGANFSAVGEVARSADDVATLGLVPLVQVFKTLDWNSLMPGTSGTHLEPLEAASPTISLAAQAVRASAERLGQIDTARLLPQVAEPLTNARGQLTEVTGALDAAASAAEIAPAMLGSQSPRNYLLVVQNNAEVRSSGGIPGALAVLNVDNGKLTLGAQSSATELGVMSPPVPVALEQQQIFSSRLGKFMQDVNLTPDFPSAAVTAKAIWERKTGQIVDGVISIDPVALGYILKATGPVKLTNPELVALTNAGLPTELTDKNVVSTLLSDVYDKIEQPQLQDAYFAGVAQEVFSALSSGGADPRAMMDSIAQGAAEGRVLVWSGLPNEQTVIETYPISGSISGPSVAATQFGVYFNDGTGAKMDYYVKRTVQLLKGCPRDGYEQTIVRVVSTNTAPLDAGQSLPGYVTGGGSYGVQPGSVQTNLVAYGPVQANVETVTDGGQQVGFAPYLHSDRPVGVYAIRLAPGESKTVDFTFGKIVQHTEPTLVVTPTVQPVKDVILPTLESACG